MNGTTKFRRNPDVVGRPLAEGEGGVLLHLKTGAYHGINTVGLMVWDRLDGEHTVDEIIAEIRDLVADAPSNLADDVSAFIAAAIQRDLVTAD